MTESLPGTSCPDCGAPVGEAATECTACGRRLDALGDTLVDAPPEVVGTSPSAPPFAEQRLFGATPPLLALALAVVAFAFAVVLFAIGPWPIGLILIGVGLLCLVAFLEVARRRPVLGHGSLFLARARASVAVESFSIRSRTAGQLVRFRRELARLSAERSRLLVALGEAAYRGEEGRAVELKAAVGEVDAAAAALEQNLHELLTGAQDRISQGRLEVQPTELVELPEPYPPPGEADPPVPPQTPEPTPARVPEPYPPPDEATPPGPVIVPEPSPPDE